MLRIEQISLAVLLDPKMTSLKCNYVHLVIHLFNKHLSNNHMG